MIGPLKKILGIMENPCQNIEEKYSAIKTTLYECPNCGEEPYSEKCETYILDGVKYPIYHNIGHYANDMGHGSNWDEVQKCVECDTVYVIENGT